VVERSKLRVETLAVHAGDPRPRIEGAAVPPIFQSTVYETLGEAENYHTQIYPRLNNLPNHLAVGGKIAALEKAEQALPTSSGMAAISTALLSVLEGGGHLLVADQLYGGTHMLVTSYLDRFGMSYDFINPENPTEWREKIRGDTRAIYVETITNPLCRVIDLSAVVNFAREHNLVSMIDATFTTPILYRPIESGFDIALHSATKYMNGHSDLVAGAIVGSEKRLAPISLLLNELGGTLDPHACFMLHRGLRTLPLRMERHCQNALALAAFLEEHSSVTRVNYPGLKSHPEHERADQLFNGGSHGGFGGMLSFELKGGTSAACQVLENLELPTPGPSLGGVETLVTRPATTSHAGLSPEERARCGISDGLILVSVGIEAVEDLMTDFGAAIDAAR